MSLVPLENILYKYFVLREYLNHLKDLLAHSWPGLPPFLIRFETRTGTSNKFPGDTDVAHLGAMLLEPVQQYYLQQYPFSDNIIPFDPI